MEKLARFATVLCGNLEGTNPIGCSILMERWKSGLPIDLKKLCGPGGMVGTVSPTGHTVFCGEQEGERAKVSKKLT